GRGSVLVALVSISACMESDLASSPIRVCARSRLCSPSAIMPCPAASRTRRPISMTRDRMAERSASKAVMVWLDMRRLRSSPDPEFEDSMRAEAALDYAARARAANLRPCLADLRRSQDPQAAASITCLADWLESTVCGRAGPCLDRRATQ